MYVISVSANDHGAAKRHHLAHEVLRDTSAILTIMNKQQAVRRGNQPIMMLTTATTPKCTESMPSDVPGGEENRNDDPAESWFPEEAAENQHDHVRDRRKVNGEVRNPCIMTASVLGMFSTVMTVVEHHRRRRSECRSIS